MSTLICAVRDDRSQLTDDDEPKYVSSLSVFGFHKLVISTGIALLSE